MLRRLTSSLGTAGALWTLAVLVAPTYLHPCPTHGSGHGSGHGSHAAAAADGGGSGIALNDARHDPHAEHLAAITAPTAPTPPVEQTPPAPCSCIDCCCATAPVTVAIGSVTAIDEQRTPAVRTSWSTADAAPARPLAHRLPFANGPPALIS